MQEDPDREDVARACVMIESVRRAKDLCDSEFHPYSNLLVEYDEILTKYEKELNAELFPEIDNKNVADLPESIELWGYVRPKTAAIRIRTLLMNDGNLDRCLYDMQQTTSSIILESYDDPGFKRMRDPFVMQLTKAVDFSLKSAEEDPTRAILDVYNWAPSPREEMEDEQDRLLKLFGDSEAENEGGRVSVLAPPEDIDADVLAATEGVPPASALACPSTYPSPASSFDLGSSVGRKRERDGEENSLAKRFALEE
jgi:hypothetical protein